MFIIVNKPQVEPSLIIVNLLLKTWYIIIGSGTNSKKNLKVNKTLKRMGLIGTVKSTQLTMY